MSVTDKETKIHHQWCSKGFGEITEGVCMLCERLYRQYPPLGHLDYTDEIKHYFPEVQVIPQTSPKKGAKGSEKGQ
jgi:hypothetical protein